MFTFFLEIAIKVQQLGVILNQKGDFPKSLGVNSVDRLSSKFDSPASIFLDRFSKGALFYNIKINERVCLLIIKDWLDCVIEPFSLVIFLCSLN